MRNNIKLVLLDRDGVLNEDRVDFVKSPRELVMLPRACEAVAQFNNAGIKVAVVTNQSCIGRGIITDAQLEEIHAKLNFELSKVGAHVDQVLYCPDHPDLASNRRKPGSGMLIEAMQSFGVEPDETVMIGDALRDLQAADSAGCHKVLVRTGKGEKTIADGILDALQSVEIYTDLSEAVRQLIQFPCSAQPIRPKDAAS